MGIKIDGKPIIGGLPGPGVPKGGYPGEVLLKKSEENYDTEWGELSEPEPYELPVATNDTLGGIKSSDGTGHVSVDADGVATVALPSQPDPYTLPTATSTILGGVKSSTGVGAVSVANDGTMSVSSVQTANTATTAENGLPESGSKGQILFINNNNQADWTNVVYNSHNILDNGDFTNPVTQIKGLTTQSFSGTVGTTARYPVDRWYVSTGGPTSYYSVNKGIYGDINFYFNEYSGYPIAGSARFHTLTQKLTPLQIQDILRYQALKFCIEGYVTSNTNNAVVFYRLHNHTKSKTLFSGTITNMNTDISVSQDVVISDSDLEITDNADFSIHGYTTGDETGAPVFVDLGYSIKKIGLFPHISGYAETTPFIYFWNQNYDEELTKCRRYLYPIPEDFYLTGWINAGMANIHIPYTPLAQMYRPNAVFNGDKFKNYTWLDSAGTRFSLTSSLISNLAVTGSHLTFPILDSTSFANIKSHVCGIWGNNPPSPFNAFVFNSTYAGGA